MLKTNHRIIFNNAATMSEVGSESVALVVTSPPYPMIEMWDEQFSLANPKIKVALESGNGASAYEQMHEELFKVWKEADRILCPGGIACINIGDATRKVGQTFQLYSNHTKITSYFEGMGYQVLPLILWRKESNKPTKFMGSGMLPPNAYVTLEHEYILIFRKSASRNFDDKLQRQQSAFFWEERNVWFSDIWYDLKGVPQKLDHRDVRERSAAYPFELAYRLISMYSIQGDTVLDPFLGTGTTMLAAMCAGRNSRGYELEPDFKRMIEMRLIDIKKVAKDIVLQRLTDHIDFVAKRRAANEEMAYVSNHYGFQVMTSQERKILFPVLTEISRVKNDEYDAFYTDEIPMKIDGPEPKRRKVQKTLDIVALALTLLLFILSLPLWYLPLVIGSAGVIIFYALLPGYLKSLRYRDYLRKDYHVDIDRIVPVIEYALHQGGVPFNKAIEDHSPKTDKTLMISNLPSPHNNR